MTAVMNTTVVRSKMLIYAQYAEYAGPDTTDTNLQAAKAVAAELDAMNPDALLEARFQSDRFRPIDTTSCANRFLLARG